MNLTGSFFFSAALPQTPFPSIEQCPQNTTGQDCLFEIVSLINITCSVLGYFPSISLYFRRNASTRLKAVQSTEWDSDDGTRNRETTITAEASDVPYTCVAADIPGLGDQKQVASIYLYALPEESTTVTEELTTFLSTEGSSNQNDRLISTYAIPSPVYRRRNVRGTHKCTESL